MNQVPHALPQRAWAQVLGRANKRHLGLLNTRTPYHRICYVHTTQVMPVPTQQHAQQKLQQLTPVLISIAELLPEVCCMLLRRRAGTACCAAASPVYLPCGAPSQVRTLSAGSYQRANTRAAKSRESRRSKNQIPFQQEERTSSRYLRYLAPASRTGWPSSSVPV